jgi:hypothetical protein
LFPPGGRKTDFKTLCGGQQTLSPSADFRGDICGDIASVVEEWFLTGVSDEDMSCRVGIDGADGSSTPLDHDRIVLVR